MAAGIAIGAGVLAVAALVVAGIALSRLRGIREAQQALLGRGSGDLVDFAVALQGRIDETHRKLDDLGGGLRQARWGDFMHQVALLWIFASAIP